MRERRKRRASSGDQGVLDLREAADDGARFLLLFGDRRRPSRPVVVAILAMEQPELPDGSLVHDRPVEEHIVPVPLEPAKNVFALEHCRGAAEGARDGFDE